MEAGYRPRLGDSAPGLVLLEHAERADRIAITRGAGAAWIYAAVPHYALRAPEESLEHAQDRLRQAVRQSTDKGMAAAFVRYTERLRGHPDTEPSLDRAYAKLRAWLDTRLSRECSSPAPAPRPEVTHIAEAPVRGGPLTAVPARGPSGPPTTAAARPPLVERLRGWIDAQRARAAGLQPPDHAASTSLAPREPQASPKRTLNQRQGDWRPPSPAGPVPTGDVDARLARWQAAQRAIDERLARAPARDCAAKRAGALRQYDFTQHAQARATPPIPPRGRPDRGREDDFGR